MNLRTYANGLSLAASNAAAHPLVQLAVMIGCVLWLVFGRGMEALAAALTIGSFILTQMVLNQQRRRDDALHLKIDELITAAEGARNQVTGTEHAAEAEIEELRSLHADARP